MGKMNRWGGPENLDLLNLVMSGRITDTLSNLLGKLIPV